MSDYCRQLVLRYPIDKADKENISNIIETKNLDYRNKDGYFEVCCTENKDYSYRYFLDYVVHSTYGEECGNFGKIRALHQSEVEEFNPLFKMIIPDIDMSKVRVVDYCWYNCSEPPTYYEVIEDDFYNPLHAPRILIKF